MSSGQVAGIEAGGTKFVCGVGPSHDEVLRRHVVSTRDPGETLAEVVEFLKDAQSELGPIKALGLASFGPINLDRGSAGYGHIIETPKRGWPGYDLRGALVRGLGCPVALDTDVTGSGLAEAALGAGRGLDNIAYLTVGTGIGGAFIAGGKPLHRIHHPEMGHIPIRRHDLDAGFAGVCPYHGDCLEGLAAGPSVVARYGQRLSDLPPDSPVWILLADYLAQMCLSTLLMGAPQRIILGGGVMSNPGLYPLIRRDFLRLNNGYVAHLTTQEAVDAFIVPPGLGDNAGLIGAFLMAEGVVGEADS